MPMPVSDTETTTNLPGPMSPGPASFLSIDIDRRPPWGMASLAFTARFITTISNWLGSTLTQDMPSCAVTVVTTPEPATALSTSSCIPLTSSAASTTRYSSCWRRAKLSSFDTSVLAFSEDCMARLIMRDDLGSSA